MSVRLEVISQSPAQGHAKRTPLLFVHGAYGAAWIWEQHFLPYFAERGYVAHAVSLRGHGGSDGWDRLALARLQDYVADVVQVMTELPVQPALIGHSMGGAIVQKVMASHPVAAAILMASVPPHGLIGSFFSMAMNHPFLFRQMSAMQTLGPAAVNGLMVRHALFSDDAPDDRVEEYLSRFQAESSLVILDLMGLDLPRPVAPPPVSAPVLVLGAENDMFVYPGAVRATAEAFGTQAEMFADMAHAMMLDHGWERVAARMADWLDGTVD